MINLLPEDAKKQIRSARTNINLISYIITLGFAIIFLIALCFISYLILSDSKTTAERTITNSSTSTSNTTSTIKTQINTINSNFSVAKTVLNNQISYSDIIMGIGSAMPTGTVIDSLAVDNKTVTLTIQARAKSADLVQTAKANLQNSNLFSSCIIGNSSTSQSDATGYPVEFSISLTVRKAIN